MSKDNKLRFDGYYVSVWTDAESFVFRNIAVKRDNYLRFYEDGEVIAATIKPLSTSELREWVVNDFSRWTKEDFLKLGRPEYYNVNDDPTHPYMITDFTLDKKSRIKFDFKWYRAGSNGFTNYEGVLVDDTIEVMIESTGGKQHKEIFKFVSLDEIKYTTRKHSDLYKNFVLHHFTSHFGGKPKIFEGDIGLEKIIPHFDMYYIPPSKLHPYYAVFTCGMGEHSMTTRHDDLKYAELCLLLPPDWKITGFSQVDSVALQPFRSLMLGGRYPFQNRIFLADGHVVIIKDSSRSVNFSSELITRFSSAFGVKNSLNSIIIDNRKINVYGVVQLFPEELNFKIAVGSDQLLNKFKDVGINPYIFAPTRENLLSGVSKTKSEIAKNKHKLHPLSLIDWHVLLDRLIEEKEPRNISAVLTRMEELFPEDYLLCFKKAILASKSRNENNSLIEQSFKDAVERNADFAHSWYLLGNLYVDRKNWDKAIWAYTNYTQLRPDDPEAWKTLSTPYVHSGLFEKGLEILQTAKGLSPNDPEISVMIKKIEVELGMI